MEQPILRNSELEKLRQVDHSVFEARTIDMTWPVEEGEAGMERRIEEICREASELVARGVNIIVLSDRNIGPERAAMPSLLAVGAVHHHLVREGTRLQIGLVVETGEAREIHHLATLIGFGASAVNPYLMFESLYALHRDGRLPDEMTPEEAEQRVIKAIGKGLLKILSKMGISTMRSYTGAQIFEAVGVKREVVDRHFTGTPSRVEGIGPEGRSPTRRSTATRAPTRPRSRSCCPPAASTPGAAAASTTAGTRRRSPRSSTPPAARTARRPTSASPPTSTTWRCATPSLRGLLRFRDDVEPVPLDEVEPAHRDRQALQVGRHVARRAVAGGPRDARGRHEPARRQVEHRRGRRGRGPLRRRAPLVDQAGGLGPLRRDRQLPRQRRRAADQGRPGRQAGRGRPAARATRSTATSPACATRRRA